MVPTSRCERRSGVLRAGTLWGDPGQHGVMKLVQHRAAAARAQPDRLNAAFLVCAYAGTVGCTQTADCGIHSCVPRREGVRGLTIING
jgi:hypothetical protein